MQVVIQTNYKKTSWFKDEKEYKSKLYETGLEISSVLERFIYQRQAPLHD